MGEILVLNIIFLFSQFSMTLNLHKVNTVPNIIISLCVSIILESRWYLWLFRDVSYLVVLWLVAYFVGCVTVSFLWGLAWHWLTKDAKLILGSGPQGSTSLCVQTAGSVRVIYYTLLLFSVSPEKSSSNPHPCNASTLLSNSLSRL